MSLTIDYPIAWTLMGLAVMVLAQIFGMMATGGTVLSPFAAPFWREKASAVANRTMTVLFVFVLLRQAGFHPGADVLGVAALSGYAMLIDALAARWPRLTRSKWLAVQMAFSGFGGLILTLAAEAAWTSLQTVV